MVAEATQGQQTQTQTQTRTTTVPKDTTRVITPPAQQQRSRPSIADKFRSAAEVPDAWGLNMMLYGPPGTGKTTLSATAQDSPHGRNVLFIDIEGGTRSVSDRQDVTVFQPTKFDEVREVFEYIVTQSHDFKTFVLDTISEGQMMGMADIMVTAKDPEWPGLQDWGKSTEQMLRLVRAFRNLAQTRSWNVILTAHAREQRDDVEGRIYVRPNLTPKVVERIGGVVDVVGYMTKEDDGSRLLQLEPTRRVMAKYRQPLKGPIPRLPGTIRNPSLVTILEHLRGGTPIVE